jgi:peptidoglycan/LPS O-acetylase OafA/YrhL
MPSERSDAIDIAKGLAILGVIFIHSELLVPSLLQEHTINRAVPIFFVLFGLTSTLWWEKTPSGGRVNAWYRSRLTRLLPPYFAAVALWWIGQRTLSSHPVGVDALAFSLAGYAPWIQTSWFVTALLQLIVVYPLLQLVPRKLGPWAALSIALATMVISHAYALQLNTWISESLPYSEEAIGFYPFWIFIPHYVWLIYAGAQMTSFARAPTVAISLIAFGVSIVAALASANVALSSTGFRVLAAITDPARTLVLLGFSAAMARADVARRVLGWLGRNSWEIYLGQMSVHSLSYPAWERVGGPVEHRLEYTLLLLLAAVGFALVVERLVARLNLPSRA